MFALPCLSLVLVLHLMFNPNFSLHPFLCSKSVFWNKCYVTVSRHDSPTEKNPSWSHHTVKMGKLCLMGMNPMMQIKRITKITHPRICICVNLVWIHIFYPLAAGGNFRHATQKNNRRPRNRVGTHEVGRGGRSGIVHRLAYPSCWKHHAGQHCLDLWLWGGWIKHNIPQMVDPSIFRCFLLVSRRENWCWRSVEKRSWFHSDCWFLSGNYLDLQKMRGKNSKNSLPNGGEKWWFTMVQSVKHHLKQIQVDFWPCKY